MSTIKTNLIKDPRVTEKASNAMEQNVYTFNVAPSATKGEVKKSFFSLYNIKPVKVNILPIPYKNTLSKGKKGVRGGGKKAVVYLKKGDKIEFV